MSVQSEIERIERNIANTYEALNEMGATMPATQNSDNLAGTARTVPQSGGGGESASNTFIVKLLTSLSASGISLSLPSDVTYSDFDNAVDNGLHVIVIAEIPSVAGDIAGTYAIPFAYKDTSGNLIFSVMVRDMNLCIIITPSGAISFTYFFAEQSGRRMDSISSSDTHMNYPSSKAVYDFVQENAIDVFYIDAILNPQTFETSNVSCSYDEARQELLVKNKIVKFRIVIPLGNNNVVYGDIVNYDANNNALVGGVTFRSDFGQGTHVYHFVASLKQSGQFLITPYIVNITSMT